MESIELLTLINKLNDLQAAIESLKIAKPVDAYSSVETKELDTALANAQGEYDVISPNRDNPFYKSSYGDLHALRMATKNALKKNGLALIYQERVNQEGVKTLHIILKHNSGQWIESRVRIIPSKADIQEYGKTLTYLKRYGTMALLGITVDKDPLDDDGEGEMEDIRKGDRKGTSLNYNREKPDYEIITKEQLDMILDELKRIPGEEEEGYLYKQICRDLDISTLAYMRKSDFNNAIGNLRRIQQARSGNPKYQ